MILTEAIIPLLTADPVISATTGDRISSEQLPQQSEIPAIVMRVRRQNGLDVLDGPLGLEQADYEVFCYGHSREEATSLRGEVRRVLAGFYGVSNGLHIKGVAQLMGRALDEFVDRVRSGTDQYRFVAVQTYLITYDHEEVTT